METSTKENLANQPSWIKNLVKLTGSVSLLVVLASCDTSTLKKNNHQTPSQPKKIEPSFQFTSDEIAQNQLLDLKLKNVKEKVISSGWEIPIKEDETSIYFAFSEASPKSQLLLINFLQSKGVYYEENGNNIVLEKPKDTYTKEFDGIFPRTPGSEVSDLAVPNFDQSLVSPFSADGFTNGK